MIPLINAVQKIREWIDAHKGTFDVAVGGTIGAGTGVSGYWDHFLQDENLYKTYDGIVNTALHTIVGAVLLWFLHYIGSKIKKKYFKDAPKN